MQPTQPTQLDSNVVALTKAVRQVESGGNFQAKGGSGEYGAYQFTEPTWNNLSQKYLGTQVPLQQATPEQQNEVAYKQFSEWKNQGYNVGQIASMWNAGPGRPNAYLENHVGTNSYGVSYDTPGYAKKVATAYQSFKTQNSAQGGNPLIPTAEASTGQPGGSQGPSVQGFLQNAVGSAGNLIGGLGNAIMHPIQTGENLLSTIGGAIEKPFGVNNTDTQHFDNLLSYFGKRYGGSSVGDVVKNIGNTLYTDPVGAALDLSTLLDGVGIGLGTVGKIADSGKILDATKAAGVAKASDFISTAQGILKSSDPEAIKSLIQQPGAVTKIADAVKTVADYTNPITAVGKVAGGVAGGIGKAIGFTAGKAIGEDSSVLRDLVEHPEDYSKAKMEAASRGGLANEFGTSLEELQNKSSSQGEGFGAIKKQTDIVNAPENWIQDVLQKGSSVEEGGKAIPFKLGLQTTEDGSLKVVADTKSFTRDPGAIRAIQHFVDTWGNKTTLTPEEFLNMRSDLSDLSKFGKDIGKSKDVELIAKALRADANKTMRPQIANLATQDAESAPIFNQAAQANKDFMTRGADGSYEFKPGAINKIANATGKGKDALLARMESVSPGITRKIEVLKNIEKIEAAKEIKVGNYTRAIFEGGALTSGNIPLIAGLLVSHPTVANQILKMAGYTSKATILPVLAAVRSIIGALPPDVLSTTVKSAVVNASSQRSQP